MKITLKLIGGQWVACHSGEGSGLIHELFGTTDLPTPFTRQTNGNDVLQRIKKLNPHCEVTLAE